MNRNLSEGQFHWDEIADRHPAYARDEGIHWAAGLWAHATAQDPDAERVMDEPTYRRQYVPIKKINYVEPERGDFRVDRARYGKWGTGEKMPPVVLVSRAGRYEVADGHHRIAAARLEGRTHVPAYVADSPHSTPYPGGHR